MSGEPTTAAEMARVRQELEQVKNRVGQLEQQRNDAIDALASATGLTRRQVLGIIGGGAGMGALGVLASESAKAAPSTGDADGDIGSPSTHWDGWADSIEIATDIVPDADGGADIGTSSLAFGSAFIDSVDAGTVTADDVDVDGGIGSTKTFIDLVDANEVVQLQAKETTVSTSATTILAPGGSMAGPIWATGRNDGGATELFHDTLSFNRLGGVDVINSNANTGTDARTYSVSGADLQLAMDAGTYSVVAFAVRLNIP